MLKITDYYAIWCKPCQALSKTLEIIKEEHPSVEISKIDIEDNRNLELVSKLNIRSVPTLIFEKDGEVVHRVSGNLSKDKLVELINIL